MSFFSWRNDPYASVQRGYGYEAMRVDSDEFKAWLRRAFLACEKRPVSQSALRNTIAALIDLAIDEPEQTAFRRTGRGELWWYIDLANEQREFAVIRGGEWEISSHAPTGLPSGGVSMREEVAPQFVRSRMMRPLQKPMEHGPIDLMNGMPCRASIMALEELRAILKLSSRADFQLLMTWCVAALIPEGPYPVLAIGGPQGAAKSTLARLLHELIDPSHAPLRSLPTSEKELFIAASNAYLLAFDNVSSIPHKISDGLCKLSTGGSFSLKKIGSNTDEVFVQFKQPVILNGIAELIQRPDLTDRTIFLDLPAIAPEERREFKEVYDNFKDRLPAIFGAVLDLVALAKHNWHLVHENALPRMAEFAKIGIAIERVFGKSGCFRQAYDANRIQASDELFELDPLALAILRLRESEGSWEGTTEDLRKKLLEQGNGKLAHGVPSGLAQLAGHLKRITPVLENRQVVVHSARTVTPDRRRIIHIW